MKLMLTVSDAPNNLYISQFNFVLNNIYCVLCIGIWILSCIRNLYLFKIEFRKNKQWWHYVYLSLMWSWSKLIQLLWAHDMMVIRDHRYETFCVGHDMMVIRDHRSETFCVGHDMMVIRDHRSETFCIGHDMMVIRDHRSATFCVGHYMMVIRDHRSETFCVGCQNCMLPII